MNSSMGPILLLHLDPVLTSGSTIESFSVKVRVVTSAMGVNDEAGEGEDEDTGDKCSEYVRERSEWKHSETRAASREPLIPSLTVISSLAVHLRYRRLKTRCERRILVRLVHNQRILANLSRNSLFWRSSPANSVLRSEPLAHLPGSPPTSPRSRSPCSPLIIPR